MSQDKSTNPGLFFSIIINITICHQLLIFEYFFHRLMLLMVIDITVITLKRNISSILLDILYLVEYISYKEIYRIYSMRGGQKVFQENHFEMSNNYEKSLNSDIKKDKGIFYTDSALTDMIIDFLDVEPGSDIIDPCCGTGNFLYAMKNHNIDESNLYGSDVDKAALNIASNNIQNSNIVYYDTINNHPNDILKKFDRKDKFDYVVGNPPYVKMSNNITINSPGYLFYRNVKDSGNNLFVAALVKAFELLKENGTVAYIIPKNFLHVSSYKLLRTKILKEKSILSIIDIGKYFKDVRGEQIILIASNKYDLANNIKFYKLKDNSFIFLTEVAQSYYSNEIIIFDSDFNYNIYNKLENSYEKFGDITKGYVGRGKSKDKDAISGNDIRKFGFKEKPVPKNGNQIFIQNIYSKESGIIASFAGDLKAKETVTVFTDGDEKMSRYVLGIFHSRLCNYYLFKYCYNSSSLTMHTDAKYLKKIPLVRKNETFDKIISLVKALEKSKYLSNEWFEFYESLNDLVYKTYDLNIDEINFIDNEMKKIQSDRWFNG